ncbi:MAG: RsmG family class I SAM-dependent methyltransferase [Mucinivorans sp.]
MEQILKYFPTLSPLQLSQFDLLQGLYEEWNAKINVISRADLSNLYERHVLHSLALARAGLIADGHTVLDLGCGGGFPSIPLAILMPQVRFTAVDSVAKKIRVAQGVAQALGLSNIEFAACRAESLRGEWSWVVSRAVAPLSALLDWSAGRYSRGLLTLKGGDLEAEIEASGVPVSVFEVSEWFAEEFFSTKKVIFVDKNLQGHKK